MARTGITYEDVTAAIDKMVAAGEAPTIMGIREVLGTGSPNTIHRHLDEWRNAQPKQQAKPVQLPAVIADALTKELERQAAEARAEISADLQRARDTAIYLASDGEELEANVRNLQEALEAKDAECLKIKADFDRQTDALSRAQHELAAERKVTNEQRDELALSKNRIITLTDQVTDLKSELATTKADAKSAHDAQVLSERACAVSTAKLESEQQKTADLVSRLSTTNDSVIALKADHKSELDALKAEVLKVREALESERKESTKSRAKYDYDYQKLNEQIALEHRKNAELQSEIDGLNDKLTAAEATSKPKK